MWFGTGGSGVSRFDGKAWTTFAEADGLANNDVNAVAVAPDGAVWFGHGTNAGVSRFDGQAWTTYTQGDGLADNWVEAIAVAPDGTVWFGTKDGVSHFDGKTWMTYRTTDGLVDNEVRSLAVAPDRIGCVPVHDEPPACDWGLFFRRKSRPQ